MLRVRVKAAVSDLTRTPFRETLFSNSRVTTKRWTEFLRTTRGALAECLRSIYEIRLVVPAYTV